MIRRYISNVCVNSFANAVTDGTVIFDQSSTATRGITIYVLICSWQPCPVSSHAVLSNDKHVMWPKSARKQCGAIHKVCQQFLTVSSSRSLTNRFFFFFHPPILNFLLFSWYFLSILKWTFISIFKLNFHFHFHILIEFSLLFFPFSNWTFISIYHFHFSNGLFCLIFKWILFPIFN